MLGDERREDLGSVADRCPRVEGRSAENLAAPDEHEGDAEVATLLRDRDHVGIGARARARHDLARLHVGECRELVTQHGGALEIELLCCAVHVCAESNGHVLCTPVENHGGRLDVTGIGGRVDEPGARRGTAADLVFEAGTRAVREKRVLAAAQAK